MEIFSPDEWEIFVEEWVEVKSTVYVEIERFGGAGDKGRDVAAYITDPRKPNYEWDCYQCKHYNQPLMPSKMWIEFGKIIYYTFIKDYPVPKNYYFVSPKGCGTSFTKLLQNGIDIKAGVKENWNNEIRTKIISGKNIELVGKLLEYVENFDFSIFDRVQPKQIIAEHCLHSNHLKWFGGGLPDREVLDEKNIPLYVSSAETNYVSQLLLAYGSDHNDIFSNTEAIRSHSKYNNHFNRARISFHHAEQLRNFSRDNLPNGTFESFQDEIFDGIINIAESEHRNGFEKVKNIETHSATIVISSNAIKDVLIVKDKSGVCHQLCNDEKLKWVE